MVAGSTAKRELPSWHMNMIFHVKMKIPDVYMREIGAPD
jgi:hypothetical protein